MMVARSELFARPIISHAKRKHQNNAAGPSNKQYVKARLMNRGMSWREKRKRLLK
jgi:hypothetical protein